MELSNWFKGFEKGIAKLSEEQRERLSSASAAGTVYNAAHFKFIKTCMNRRPNSLPPIIR